MSIVKDTVKCMLEEAEITKELVGIGTSLFKRQLEEAFTFPAGPKNYWTHVEDEWKIASGGKPIPTKHRTNKSVILKAWETSHVLAVWRDKKGGILGKSAIVKAIADSVPNEELGVDYVVSSIRGVLDKAQKDMNVHDRADVYSRVKVLIEKFGYDDSLSE